MRAEEILREDLDTLEAALQAFSPGRFGMELAAAMEEKKLSSVELSKRLFVSHTIVDKWKKGSALPNSKERVKELGMALGMDVRGLDAFLLRCGYPALYLKNPLDSAARLLLIENAGRDDVVGRYRELVHRLGLDRLATVDEDEVPLATAALSREFHLAVEQGKMDEWFGRFRGQFERDGKKQLSGDRLGRFLLLYLGDRSVNALALEGELPAKLRDVLYPVYAGKGVKVRGLREKLISLGLFADMTEEEIDAMLGWMKLRPITEPVTAGDMAVLAALRLAHERCPLYERDNLRRVCARLTPPADAYDEQLLAGYRQKLKTAESIADYYEAHTRREERLAFEKKYTSYADRGVIDYVRDLVAGLALRGVLGAEEAVPLLELLHRSGEEEEA